MKTIAALMMFINAHTGFPVPADPPEVRYHSRCFVQQAFGQPCNRHGIYAFYETPALIMIDRNQKGSSIGQSILVHELVHYMQDKAGAPRTERQAYRVQIAYLRSVGDDPCNYDGTLAREAGC